MAQNKQEALAFSEEAIAFLKQLPILSDEARLTTEQVAIIMNCGKRTLEEDRRLGRGIPFEKHGKWVRYRLGALRDFLAKLERQQ